MANLLSEQRISLTQAARQQNVNVSTVWRWHSRGCRGVVLETFLVGGRRFTTVEAVARFVEQLNSADRPHLGEPPRDAQREVQVQQAEEWLRTEGV